MGKSELRDKLSARLDAWQNIVNGLNTSGEGSNSRLANFQFYAQGIGRNPGWLESLYYADDMAQKICRKPAEHMLRERPKVNLGEATLAASTQILQSKLDELDVYPKLIQALTWENVFGGAAILIGADDGRDPSEPLDVNAVESVDFLTVFTPRDLTARDYYKNPLSPKWGKPETYSFTEASLTGQVFHETRFLTFLGGMVTAQQRQSLQGWGLSKLDAVYSPLQIYNSVWISLAELVQDASQGIFGFEDLAGLLADEGAERLVQRMVLLDKARSIVNAVMIDKNLESFDRVATNFSNLPELTDRMTVRLAAAAEIPVAILVGREPSGLNATGEADVRNWYDQVAASRRSALNPKLEYLLHVILRSKDGPTKGVEPDNWTVDYPSLWQPTPSEDADVKLKHAQRDEIYLRNGVVTPEEVALGRFPATGYAHELTTVDVDSRNESEALDETQEPQPEPQASQETTMQEPMRNIKNASV